MEGGGHIRKFGMYDHIRCTAVNLASIHNTSKEGIFMRPRKSLCSPLLCSF